MRDALDAFSDQNKKVFAKVSDVVRKFGEQERKIKELEDLTKKSKIDLK